MSVKVRKRGANNPKKPVGTVFVLRWIVTVIAISCVFAFFPSISSVIFAALAFFAMPVPQVDRIFSENGASKSRSESPLR